MLGSHSAITFEIAQERIKCLWSVAREVIKRNGQSYPVIRWCHHCIQLFDGSCAVCIKLYCCITSLWTVIPVCVDTCYCTVLLLYVLCVPIFNVYFQLANYCISLKYSFFSILCIVYCCVTIFLFIVSVLFWIFSFSCLSFPVTFYYPLMSSTRHTSCCAMRYRQLTVEGSEVKWSGGEERAIHISDCDGGQEINWRGQDKPNSRS